MVLCLGIGRSLDISLATPALRLHGLKCWTRFSSCELGLSGFGLLMAQERLSDCIFRISDEIVGASKLHA